MAACILAIDQGTTGTRAILYGRTGQVLAQAYREIPQHYPKPGWVEHDPEDLWRSTCRVIQTALARGRLHPSRIAAIGITNQRETTLVWNRRSSRPLHQAIVWQDRRTAQICRQLKRHEPEVRRTTGLVLDPYFSGTKLTWLFRSSAGLLRQAKAGKLAFGTVDSWLLWHLTGGRVHATDVTNASRTLLWDLKARRWSHRMRRLLGVPEAILPAVFSSSHRFGVTTRAAGLPSGIPIAGIAGDQQAALFGQGCVRPGQAKNTYGTGCFFVLHTGSHLIRSRHGLLSTAACDARGEPAFALEGSVFIAGAAIQWLRDGLGILKEAGDSERLARSVPDTGGVMLVPAFVGLGAPYWNPHARGLISGLTRGTGRAHLVRAALEGIAFQSEEVLRAMEQDARVRVRQIRVDGAATANNFLMQFQADLFGRPVLRPVHLETTALGAAQLAGLQVGFWTQSDLARMRRPDRLFRPRMRPAVRRQHLLRWREAVKKTVAGC